MPAALFPGTNEEAAKRRSASPAASGGRRRGLRKSSPVETSLGSSHSRAATEAVHVYGPLLYAASDQRRLRHQDSTRWSFDT